MKEKKMQIQLNQTEIETALRNYVGSILSLNDNVDIQITLKATRGEDGQTAIIDIVPKVAKVETVAATSAVAVQRRPRVTAVQGVSGGTPTSDTKAAEGNEKSAIEKLQAGEVVGSSTSSDADAMTGNANDASPAGEASGETAAQDDQAEEKPQRSSLFSGLNRPKNS